MANYPPCLELGNEIKQDDSRVHNPDSFRFSKAINSTIFHQNQTHKHLLNIPATLTITSKQD
jgi:hypothetical protein